MAGASDILVTLQNGVASMGDVAQQLARQVPDLSSGNVSAAKLIQVGPVRLLGISVIVPGAQGLLHDTGLASSAASGNAIAAVLATAGFYAVNMVFVNGMVYVPGAAQVASFHYSRLV